MPNLRIFSGKKISLAKKKNIPVFQDLDIKYKNGLMSKSEHNKYNKRISKQLKGKIIEFPSFNYSKYKISEFDYIKQNPKALRLRFNKSLRIFSEKYGLFAENLLKNKSFTTLYSRLPLEDKINVLNNILSSRQLIESYKKKPDFWSKHIINSVGARLSYIDIHNKISILKSKYPNNPKKILSEVKSEILGKYISSYEEYSTKLNKIEFEFSSIGHEKLIDIFSEIYVFGINSFLTKHTINASLVDLKIKGKKDIYNN